MQTVHKLSIAPMIDYTNTHFRVFMRILAPQALLYTEMETTGAVDNNPSQSLAFHPMEHPLVLQLGGSCPKALAKSAKAAEQAGFDQINLNFGCPSDRVQAGRFGACLMAESNLAASLIGAIKEVVNLPVTAKTRIGIDNQDSYHFFSDFAHGLVAAGCDALIVHARKAWLHGLSPKQNRTIPPLHYDYVYAIKAALPNVPVIINGNIQTLDAIQHHLTQVDGVMLGRLAYNDPYAIAQIHHALYPAVPKPTRAQVLMAYLEYAIQAQQQGTPVRILLKPLFQFNHGLAGAKQWKQNLMLAIQNKACLSELLESKGIVFPDDELLSSV